MIVGCGIDTEELSRFDKHLADVENSGFVKLVFTEREIENYKSNFGQFIPLGFCCKEAVFKAVGDSWTTSPVHWQDIELLFKSVSQSTYEIKISGHAKKILERLGNPTIVSEFNMSPESVTFHVILINE